ncbi:Abca17 [Scenedesmus sp. PABB004]|nr:Abca17 [Scenedesmus sp. PABB004]
MAELGALRTARAALDEGLISAQDFDVVKVAFLRAQQIKAGLDAGFIRREDYDKAVTAYLHAMDFQLIAAVPALSGGGAAAGGAAPPRAPAPAPAPAQQQYQPPPPAPSASLGGGRAVALGGAAAAAGGAAASSGFTPRSSSGGGGLGPALAGGGASGTLSAHTSVSEDGGALRDIPGDLPDYCKGATAGKYKWLIFKVDDSGRTVVPDKIGGQASSYNDFVCALPDGQCRYAVYDYEYRSPERGTFKKLVFLLWAPDDSGVKPKMMYASTKDFFKSFLEGIGAELQATEPSEISEEEIRDRVIGSMTRKPLLSPRARGALAAEAALHVAAVGGVCSPEEPQPSTLMREPSRRNWLSAASCAFGAVLRKNFILQTRGRRTLFGLGGWAGLVAQVLLPVGFFALMCIPKHYIQPYQHPRLLQAQEHDLDTKAWAGATPYEGPASATGAARVVLVPDTPPVAALAARLAMAVSCPPEPYKRICSPGSITTFACLFGVAAAPRGCEARAAGGARLGARRRQRRRARERLPACLRRHAQDAATCMATPACYARALAEHITLLPSEAAALALLEERPHSVDAVVVFPRAAAAAAPAGNASAGGGGGGGGCGALGGAPGDGVLLEYAIRMNATDVPPTQLLRDLFDVSPGLMPLPGNLLWAYRGYWFLANLQLAIDRSLLGGRQGNGTFPASLSVRVKPFPCAARHTAPAWPAAGGALAAHPRRHPARAGPAKLEDLGAASAAAFFNLLLVYAFLAPTRAVVGAIVREKELRLREGMRIFGLSVGLYPFAHSSLWVMLAFYWLFAAALIAFSYALSTLFAASRVAGTATQLIYALSMIPGRVARAARAAFLLPFVRPYGGASWYWASLSPTSAASLFAAALVNWERLAAGVTVRTLWLPVTQGSAYSAGTALAMLALDVLLFGALAWYGDKVVPSTHGQVLPPWFPLSPSYWRADGGGEARGAVPPGAERPGGGAQDAPGDEPEGPGGAPPAIDVRACAAGRITALLGHNGAGKTTTIHMLTGAPPPRAREEEGARGPARQARARPPADPPPRRRAARAGMLQPSGGSARINGLDIATRMPAIRQSLGICPQPDITVAEHLALYAAIKGADRREAETAALRAAVEVGLADKLGSLAGELSGGQRRKLSVAIAFLGDPAVVFLDEPTSGMDPFSRRATWEVIRRRRGRAAIVLTTHSMEEADCLADDIHILAEGRLVASGSPLELKARYGVGYTLTAVLAHPGAQPGGARPGPGAAPGGGADGGAAALGGAAARLAALVRAHVPAAVLLSAAGGEVALRLPKEAAGAFPALLRELEARAAALGVSSYGLSVTTLEEVFLAVADHAVTLHGGGDGGSGVDGGSGGGGGGDSGSGGAAAAAAAAAAARRRRRRRRRWRRRRGGGAAAARRAPPRRRRRAPARPSRPAATLLCPAATPTTRPAPAAAAPRRAWPRRCALLVPLGLVAAAMGVASMQASTPAQPALPLTRGRCLGGTPALLAAAPAVRQQVEFRGLLDSYPRSDLVDTRYTQLYRGSAGPPLNLTLEGQLLAQWASGAPRFDALYVAALPRLEALLAPLGGAPALTLLLNQSAPAALPAALGQATSALLRLMVAAGGGGPNIRASSAPLPLVRGEAAARVRADAGALMLVLCMTLAVSVLSASFVVFLVRETENGSKHLQLVSGAPPTAFWAANFAWDAISFALSACGMLALVAWFNAPQLAGRRLAALAVLLAGFGPAGIGLTYLSHSAFRDEMRALQRLNTAYFLPGYLGFTATWVLGLVARVLGRPGLAAAAARARAACCARRGLPVPGLQPEGPTDPFAWEVLGTALAHLAAQAVVFGGAAVLLDVGVGQLLRRWRRPARPPPARPRRGAPGLAEDAGVAAERRAVQAGERLDEAMVVLDGVTKSYPQGPGEPRLLAVAGLWLRVWPGECFGLLGVNGAGKTTTFKLLTGEAAPDAGNATIAGRSVLTQLAAARRCLGYCPQFEALPGAMTGREVLALYARLRGVAAAADVSAMADALLARLGLSAYGDTPCGALSGGSKRKLSVAVALVGGPPLVLLDEPSTGMDPSARRFLWRVLQSEVLGAGRTIILTSHSMEEVDALASRLAILAAGRARCCGTPQRLKGAYGDGYTLELRLRPRPPGAAGQQGAAGQEGAEQQQQGAEQAQGVGQRELPEPAAAAAAAAADAATAAAERHFLAALPGAVVLEREPGRLLLRLPIASPGAGTGGGAGRGGLSLADAFEAVERGRAALGVSEFSLSQSSLERVFLALAAAAAAPADGE